LNKRSPSTIADNLSLFAKRKESKKFVKSLKKSKIKNVAPFNKNVAPGKNLKN
jgi:hypothetical protein